MRHRLTMPVACASVLLCALAPGAASAAPLTISPSPPVRAEAIVVAFDAPQRLVAGAAYRVRAHARHPFACGRASFSAVRRRATAGQRIVIRVRPGAQGWCRGAWTAAVERVERRRGACGRPARVVFPGDMPPAHPCERARRVGTARFTVDGGGPIPVAGARFQDARPDGSASLVVARPTAVRRLELDWEAACVNASAFALLPGDTVFQRLRIAADGTFEDRGPYTVAFSYLGRRLTASARVRTRGRFVSRTRVHGVFSAALVIRDGRRIVNRCRTGLIEYQLRGR